jgi:hypothetical protein
MPTLAAAHEAERRAHFSQRIRVEHGISHLKNWPTLSRHNAAAVTGYRNRLFKPVD